MTTRGIRNNNPGNIDAEPNVTWQGQVAGDDPRFCTFDTPADGIRALARLLHNYQRIYGLNTVTGIIDRWAPPAENDTPAYIADVAARMGVAPDAGLDLNDSAQLAALVQAIIAHENGEQPYDLATIDAGVASALA